MAQLRSQSRAAPTGIAAKLFAVLHVGAVRTKNDVVVLDALSGATLRRLDEGKSQGQARVPRWLVSRSWCNQSIAISPDSKTIAVACNDNKVRLWSWESCKSSTQILKAHKAAVRCVAISNDGERVFSGSADRTLRIWDITTGAAFREYRQPFGVNCLALSADSQKIALCLVGAVGRWVQHTLRVLDSCTGAVLFARENRTSLRSIAFCPNDLCFVTGSSENIELWCTQTWPVIRKMDMKSRVSGVKSVSFSPDGKQIVAGSDRGSLWLWSVESGAAVRTVCSLQSSVNCAVFSGDGKRVISGSDDGRVRVWDSNSNAQYTEAIDELSRDVCDVAISRDGLRVASTSGYKPVRLWDSQTGAQIGKLQPQWGVRCISFSPDGRRLVCEHASGVLRLWDLETFAVIGDTMKGHRDSVSCVAFSFEGLRIVSGSDDGTIRVWNAVSLTPIGDPLEGFREGYRVRHVAECVDGLYIVTCNVWDDIRVYVQSAGKIMKTLRNRAQTEHGTGDKTSEGIENETEIDDNEAVRIIRSCSCGTSRVWPSSVPKDDNVVYVRGNQMYSNALGQTVLLGSMPREETIPEWEYNTKRNAFAATLEYGGGVAICMAVFD